ncbi:cysteine desulfurase family protein [Caldisalinibacter kiritimatiensis]|uniref:Cysteine desulfurase n=1 Tax=Caldisalinibacter kiritimatiensis TaxID=1304284 RepID=R1ATH6_9FIRM|nr:cysteine desulfurase family protein [Caldisalinibacter kiritimatiensis]EOC99931.1 Cysteine desulfurase [Caldisalinibacter kiritimatiensis]
MIVYLDNSATTRPRDEVIDVMNNMLKIDYGNPSSLHRMGLEAEKKVESSRQIIADFLRVRKDEIFFTSGGTESNNIAIQGLINKNSRAGKHIITTEIEHSSVLNIFKAYEQRGYDITYLNVDEYGFIDIEQLENSIREDTIVVSIMLVNNEIGTIQNLKQIKKIISKKNNNVKLHIDGVQAFGKIKVDIKDLGIDTFSFSGHKIHGPKGVGGLYVRKDVNLDPIVFGGNQERGIRSGTENVPGIVGLGKAVEILRDNFTQEKEKILSLKKYFASSIQEKIDNIKMNSLLDNRSAPHILNISFIGVKGEVLLHYLERFNIFVSTGSACSSHKKGKSHVLKAINLKDQLIDGTVRFSFAYSNTKEELDFALDKLIESVNEIRKITMR